MDDNPLLSTDFRIPFDRITPEHVVPATRHALARAERELAEQVAAHASNQAGTFASTIGALDDLALRLARTFGVVRHLNGVSNSPELRSAFNEVLPEVTAFFAKLTTHDALWQVVKRYADSSEARALDPLRARHLRKTVDEFRRAGADLPEAERARAEALKVELAKLGTRFGENVLDATNAYELVVDDPAMLDGLPEGAMRRARDAAAARGQAGYRFTLQAPSYMPFMKYVADRALRQELHQAFHRVGTEGEHDNRGVVREILAKRRELANLLGYRDYADLVLEDRMMKSGERAVAFERELMERTAPYFEREVAQLERFAADELGIEQLEAWDLAFVSEKMRLARLDLDEEALRPYFPLDAVLHGLFQLTERLFGVRVEAVGGVPTWHPEVQVYDLRHEDGTFLGSLYADWFPRESKRAGAWMNGIVTGGPTAAGFDPHVGVIIANFTPPDAGGAPLLTHDEVQTVFHEFGHLLHHLMCRVELRARASMNVAWDFVELPSQILENWTWEREALDLFAHHHRTGETIPEALFQNLKRGRTFLEAIAQMRQLSYGTADLALHVAYDPFADGDPFEVARAAMEPMEVRPEFAQGERLARFSHVFAGGYAAGYYSYKWSEVLEADAFGRFAREGIFNPDTGRAFAREILAKGDSDDPEALFRAFMGRDPDPSALIRRNLGPAPAA